MATFPAPSVLGPSVPGPSLPGPTLTGPEMNQEVEGNIWCIGFPKP